MYSPRTGAPLLSPKRHSLDMKRDTNSADASANQKAASEVDKPAGDLRSTLDRLAQLKTHSSSGSPECKPPIEMAAC